MKLTASVLGAGLALSGLFVLSGSARAAGTVTAIDSDLILGFRATGGTGATLNLEVDLGPVSQFYDAAPGTEINLSGPNGLAVADLIATYGPNWSTRTDLFFGLIAGTGRAAGTTDGHAPANTIWASAPEVGGSSAAWFRLSSQGQGAASRDIEALYSLSPGSFSGKGATANSSVSSIINFDGTQATTGSWSSEDLIAPTSSFSIFNPTIDLAVSSIVANGSPLDGTSYAVLDLYEMQPNTSGTSEEGTFIGAFGLNSSGNLVFDTNPVLLPEPGSISLLGCGFLLAFGRRRRSGKTSPARI